MMSFDSLHHSYHYIKTLCYAIQMDLIFTRYVRSSKNAPDMKNSGAMLYWKLTEHLIVEKIHNPKNSIVEKSEKTESMKHEHV